MVAATGLPPDWEPRWSRTYKRAYIWNNTEQYSIWIGDKEPLPEGTDKEQLYLYLNQEIEASHLLIKHNQSRNKSSWREEHITRSKDEARAILERHRATILEAGESGRFILPELCKTESDCSSASKAGLLGTFGFGTMQQPFWDASVALKQYELSDIVETASGLHLIQRWNADPEKKPKSDAPVES